MYNILKNIKPNVILSASGGYGGFRTDSLSLIAAKILNIKVRILSIHHCYTKPIAWNFVLRMLDRLIIKSTSCLVFGSNAVKKDIKKNTILLEYFVKSKIIHHGVSLKRNTENKINLIKLFKTKNDVFKVGMLSRIEKNKGHFAIVPGNPEKSELIKRIASNDPAIMMPVPESHLGRLTTSVKQVIF